VFKFV